VRTVSAYEAKTHLPRILRETEEGASFTITRHGNPVAMLVPVGKGQGAAVQEVIAELRRFRVGKTLGGENLKDLISEGRR